MNYASGYNAWLAKYGRGNWIAERPARVSMLPLVSEALLRCMWYDQLFIPSLLQTERGDPVVVDHPGIWNTAPGPDFLNARVRIGPVRRTGDVEIHLTTRGWRSHGHHLDPAYNRVILHAALWKHEGDDSSAMNSSGAVVPEIVLEPCLVKPLEDLLCEIEVDQYPERSPASAGQCRTPRPGLRQDRLIEWVMKAGDARFEAKIRRASHWLDSVPEVREAWAWALVENFGFGGFRRAYSHAAELCRSTGWDSFFNANASPRLNPTGIIGRAIMDSAPLHPRRSMRPQASHTRRIRALSAVLSRLAEPGRWDRHVSGVADALRHGATAGRLRALRSSFNRILAKGESDGSVPSGRWVGNQIRDILFINFFLPFWTAKERAGGSRSAQGALYACYCAVPRLAENRIEKQAIRTLFGASKDRTHRSPQLNQAIKLARFQQGLHKLYEDLCALGSEGCERCSIPASLETAI